MLYQKNQDHSREYNSLTGATAAVGQTLLSAPYLNPFAFSSVSADQTKRTMATRGGLLQHDGFNSERLASVVKPWANEDRRAS